jgi:hypothetical protein
VRLLRDEKSRGDISGFHRLDIRRAHPVHEGSAVVAGDLYDDSVIQPSKPGIRRQNFKVALDDCSILIWIH